MPQLLHLTTTPRVRRRAVARLLAVLVFAPALAFGQSTPPNPPAQEPGRITLPPVTVTAQKEPAEIQKLPLSVTALSAESLDEAGITTVNDASIYAPNTFFSDFTARKLSNARFRGIGSSPANPSITTFIDGVPQLNANSSNIEFTDVAQVEFVRGPQSALFGRNTLGGLVNIVSGRPSLTKWTGSAHVPFGNFGAKELRGAASGPLSGTVAVGLSIGHGEREGFTNNDVTGNDLDYRSGTFGKAQLLWTPAANFETRVIVSGERARDGDYALNDLAALRANPFHSSRNFEGHTDRDIFSTTIQTRREGQRLSLSTTTGVVSWKTLDTTDLDYSAMPFITRDNDEKDFQFTQEVRLASAANAPVKLSDTASLRWQSGVFLFTQNYDQDAVNNIAGYLISPALSSIAIISQHSPEAALDDVGVGVYGQGTFTLNDRVDLTAGARVDYEKKQASMKTFYSVPIAPPTSVDTEESFSHVSPQFSAAYRFRPERMVYASVGSGYKAGGFNPASPSGSEAYSEEETWNVEAGLKTSWADGKVSANAAVFSIDWNDLQLNIPNPNIPAQFFIANVGNATSRGVEFEMTARPHAYVDLFASVGYTHARFGDNSVSNGVPVAGNTIPNTPDYTTTLGAQLSRPIGAASLYGRAEATFYGALEYDDANSARQDAYSLANFRAGVRGRFLFAEAWVRNAFDTRYIPVAFAYGNFAPSGFVGESGRPRTFGVSGGVSF